MAADAAEGRTAGAIVTTSQAGMVHFPCSACGAGMSFSANTTMVCKFCGATKEFDDPERPVPMRNLDEALKQVAESAQAGLESELTCPSCGGTVGFSGTYNSPSCPYCANPVQEADVHAAAPGRVPVDAVYPFLIDEAGAVAALDAWAKEVSFLPSGFREGRRAHGIKALYLPYLEFEVPVHVDYVARGGHRTPGEKDGLTREDDHVSWGPWESGSLSLTLRGESQAAPPPHSDLRFPAVSAAVAGGTPRAYRPEYVAGILTRPYEGDLENHYADVSRDFDLRINSAINDRLPGDAFDVKEQETAYGARTYRLVLCPFYAMTVRHKGKAWQVYIDGHTGSVSGDRPESKLKIYAVTAAIVLVLVLLKIFL